MVLMTGLSWGQNWQCNKALQMQERKKERKQWQKPLRPQFINELEKNIKLYVHVSVGHDFKFLFIYF